MKHSLEFKLLDMSNMDWIWLNNVHTYYMYVIRAQWPGEQQTTLYYLKSEHFVSIHVSIRHYLLPLCGQD